MGLTGIVHETSDHPRRGHATFEIQGDFCRGPLYKTAVQKNSMASFFLSLSVTLICPVAKKNPEQVSGRQSAVGGGLHSIRDYHALVIVYRKPTPFH
jgi:hypothetical protein